MKSIFCGLTLAILNLLFASTAFSQKENNTWYFGNQAGIDFSSGVPVALTNGALFTYDNSSTVSDSAGHLLFYTNGVSVWNKNHLIMANGTGLLGHTSGGQSALIVRQPMSSLYYIFTTDAFAGANGFRYSIVNMALNGGLGDVTTKNALLFTPSSERIAAVYNCNANSAWIISHPYNSNQFKVYSLSTSGLNTTPVTSTIGAFLGGSTDAAVGQMTLSKNGSKLVAANYNAGTYELFDFDMATGILSNLETIPGITRAWGTAFSPNGRFLYCTQWTFRQIWQFDLASGNIATIISSKTLVGTVTVPGSIGYYAGYLQLGPDDKVYVAKFEDPYLSSLNAPDSLGLACGFVDNSVYLNGRLSEAGLSRAVSFTNYTDSIVAFNFCEGDSTSLTLADTSYVVSCRWDFGDPSSGASNSSNAKSAAHVFSSDGTYAVTAYVDYGCQKDTLENNITIHSKPAASISGPAKICNGQSIILFGSGGTTFQWSGAATATTPSISVSPLSNSIYYLNVSVNGCASDTVSFLLTVDNPPLASFTYTPNPCSSTFTFVQQSGGATTTLWNFGDGVVVSDSNHTVSHTYTTKGNFNVMFVAGNACGSDTDTQVVSVNPPPVIAASPDTVLCSGSSTPLSATGAMAYLWTPSTGLNTDTGALVLATPTTTTTFTVIGTDTSNCSDTAVVHVTVNPLPIIVTSPDTQICRGEYTYLTASGASFYQWSPSTGLFSTTGSGVQASPFNSTTYTVTGTDSNNCSSASFITVTANPIPNLQVTRDSIICLDSSLTLQATGAATYQWIPSTYLNTDTGSQVITTPLATIAYTVYGYSVNNCANHRILYVTVQPPPPSVVSPAGPLSLCGQTSVSLSANFYFYYTYQWYFNNAVIPGGNAFQLTASNVGTYKVKETDIRGCNSFSNDVELLSGTSNLNVTIASSAANSCSPNTIYTGYGPQSIVLTANATGAAGYTWSTGDTTRSITVTASGTYSVTARDAAGCTSPQTAQSQIQVTVIDIRCGNNSNKVLLCHVPPGNSGNPQTICVAPSAVPAHLASHPGDCLGTCGALRLAPGQLFTGFEISVYPNPFAKTFTLHSETPGFVQLVIRDLTGRIVESHSVEPGDTEFGARLVNGVYLLEVIQGGQRQVLRVVKAD